MTGAVVSSPGGGLGGSAASWTAYHPRTVARSSTLHAGPPINVTSGQYLLLREHVGYHLQCEAIDKSVVPEGSDCDFFPVESASV